MGKRSKLDLLHKGGCMVWWYMFLGHCTADYFGQSDWMAQNKFKKGWTGTLACLIHSVEYSLIVTFALFLAGIHDPVRLLLLFLAINVTHYPIDRYSLAKYWLKFYNKKSLPEPFPVTAKDAMASYSRDTFFYWVVYLIQDNTAHLVLMTIAVQLLT